MERLHENMTTEQGADTMDVLKNNIAVCVLPSGAGFGEGSISYKDQMDSMGEKVDTSALETVCSEVLTSGSCLVAIDDDITDDGCGDGRAASEVFSFIPQSNEVKTYKKSMQRAKVFGGGAVTGREMLTAVLGTTDGTILQDLKQATQIIEQENTERINKGVKGIKAGAHTDDHGHGANCGCGAIDKSPVIIANTVKYADQHEPLIAAMMGEDYDQTLLPGQLQINKQRSQESYLADHNGASTIQFLLEEGSVVKKLAGGHKEMYLYVNKTPNTTMDQQAFTEQVRANMIEIAGQSGGVLEDASDEEVTAYANQLDPQVFVVDEWRLREYAGIFADHLTRPDATVQGDLLARKNTEQYQSAFKKALYAGWNFTLATATTLTDGTQPVFATA